MHDSFADYHPLVTFIYFMLVLIIGVICLHPVCLCIWVICSLIYAVYLKGKNAFKMNFKYMVPILIVTALLNPAFNHEGMTILFYLKNGNPVTLESIYYGLAAAAMMAGALNWFSCYSQAITTDKLMCIFGRIMPAFSLIISMTMRFVPRFKAQIKRVSQTQRCIGRDVSNGNMIEKAKHGLLIISIMVTWALENAIETADSMKSRGYGLPGRTAYSIYSLEKRDKLLGAFIAFCGTYIIVGLARGGIDWYYFPKAYGKLNGTYTISLYFCYFILCIIPMIINWREDLKWNALKSKI